MLKIIFLIFFDFIIRLQIQKFRLHKLTILLLSLKDFYFILFY